MEQLITNKNFTVEDELPVGLISWCSFKPGSKVLCVGKGAEVFAGYFQQKEMDAKVCESWEKVLDYKDKKFDIILILREIEEVTETKDFLEVVKGMLAPKGHIYISFENRFGLQFFCGDKDPYTHRIFDGIEGYQSYLKEDRRVFDGRLYSKAEVEGFLNEAGLVNRKFYSILPGLAMPQQMFAEGYFPTEELEIRYSPLYHNPKTVFLNQERLFNGLIENDMFHQMANAYLVDVTLDGEFDNATHITTSMDRGHEFAMATILRDDDTVEKKAIYNEGQKAIAKLIQNTTDLANRGVKVVPVEQNELGDGLIMPFIDAPTATTYLREVFYSDKEKFVSEMDRFVQSIKKASPELTGEAVEAGELYKQIYPDMVPHNCFYINGDFVFFDQEFCIEIQSLNVTLVRAIDSIYMGDRSMEQEMPRTELFARYGVEQKANLLRMLGDKFIKNLRNVDQLLEYRNRYWADYTAISNNRLRMNYTPEEMERLYEFPMKDAADKKIFIFGTGNWAKSFVGRFADFVAIEGAVDNNEAKWGDKFEGIDIVSPSVLKELKPSEYKIIICIKHCTSIISQLENLGAKYFSAYDPDMDWPEAKEFYRTKGELNQHEEVSEITDINDSLGLSKFSSVSLSFTK